MASKWTKINIKLINKEDLVFEINGNVIIKKIHQNFRIHTIYIGQIDGFIKEKFSDLDGDNFIGCIRDVILNERSIIKLDHIHHVGRLTNTCQLSKRGRKFINSCLDVYIS